MRKSDASMSSIFDFNPQTVSLRKDFKISIMETKAILIADLSGYTAMTEMHGAAAAAIMIERYERLVHSCLVGDSIVLERVGDQVVVVSEKADDIASTAINLYEKAKLQHHFLPVHAGLHYGEVLVQNGHLYGSTLNLTARIAASAKEDTILCSVAFLNALSQPVPFEYRFHGLLRFKNVIRSQQIMELLLPSHDTCHQKFIDPVCHLQLNERESLFKLRRRNKVYHFCSQHCMNVFQEISKEVYLA